jgi:hypothetical protein
MTKLHQSEPIQCLGNSLLRSSHRVAKPSKFHQPLDTQRHIDRWPLWEQHQLVRARRPGLPLLIAMVLDTATARRKNPRNRMQKRRLAACVRPNNCSDPPRRSVAAQWAESKGSSAELNLITPKQRRRPLSTPIRLRGGASIGTLARRQAS